MTSRIRKCFSDIEKLEQLIRIRCGLVTREVSAHIGGSMAFEQIGAFFVNQSVSGQIKKSFQTRIMMSSILNFDLALREWG